MQDNPIWKKIKLTPSQKTQLFSLGLREPLPEQDVDEQKADLLYDILKRPLPNYEHLTDSLPNPLRGLSYKVRSVAGAPLGELIQDPNTDISLVTRIKEYAKQAGTSTSSEIEKGVFLVIYYAAIANALIFHNKKITQHTDEDRRGSRQP